MIRKTIIAIIASFALMAAAAPPASADYGDWWTQYNKTQSRLGDAWSYVDSYTHGDHSRRFNHRYRFYSGGHFYCHFYFQKISHSYIVWDEGYFATWQWC